MSDREQPGERVVDDVFLLVINGHHDAVKSSCPTSVTDPNIDSKQKKSVLRSSEYIDQ